MRVIIIDDEPRSHSRLKSLFATNHPELEFLESGFCVADGVNLIGKYQPDLIFLDIEMPDGTGFDLLQKISNHTFKVIFITGHNRYAMTAIKFGALDYLLKPVDEEELAEAIERAEAAHEKKMSPDQLAILWETLANFHEKKLPTRLAITTSEGIHFKQVKDIVRFEADYGYTKFTLVNQKELLASLNIGEYVDQFEIYHEFMKVHRSHVVNLHFVEKYVKSEGGYLVMNDGVPVTVSKLYRDELLDRLTRI